MANDKDDRYARQPPPSGLKLGNSLYYDYQNNFTLGHNPEDPDQNQLKKFIFQIGRIRNRTMKVVKINSNAACDTLLSSRYK